MLCQVTPFESMFTKSGGRAVNIPVSKHDSDSSNDFKKYWMPDDQCKVSVVFFRQIIQITCLLFKKNVREFPIFQCIPVLCYVVVVAEDARTQSLVDR